MARPLRIEYPGAWYHVTCRGNEKRVIFREDRDKVRFLEILHNTLDPYGVEVHSYVLMDNHFHLILRTQEANLHNFMQRFNTTYTIYFNRRFKRSGHLYQGRYKAILIEAGTCLPELSRYVHLNPVRIKKFSGLEVKEKHKIIRNFSWSSYYGYIRMKDRQPFVNYSNILSMIGKGDDRDSRRKYDRFVMGGIKKEMVIPMWEGVRSQSILGSEDFADRVYRQFLSKRGKGKRVLHQPDRLKSGPITIKEIARKVAEEFGVAEDQLYLQRASCREARSIFMELCSIYLNRRMSFKDIGRMLGDISVSALSQNRKRLLKKIKNDDRLRQRYQSLKTLI